ncbi:phosphotransferase domain-containing protein [Catenovulum agarivorans DS-2]|uniref:Phosphotransferase domain-containing protein n=1 Tax=Catenovulum agarivorans DS-2 TaxID=1328313 RepID=W7QLT1_9ALTE|nr:PHP domain-containing protein [Catenovulum agarivorans]EWH09902.1 phosphotransferase domain-containing protein [Catenovulum agarivorans DS-2]
MKIDLHSHTKCSDGALTPEELVLRAFNKGVDVLAITDHDTTSALAEARSAIQQHNIPLQLIAGVEISTRWHGFEIHVVGLNIDESNSALKQTLASQIQARDLRAQKIATKLARVIEGYTAESILRRVQAKAQGNSISRVHFAQVILEDGLVSRIQQAFDKYLGRKGKAYAAPEWISIEKAIEVIHAAGGQATLAHPTRYDLKNKWIRKLVDYFAAVNGDAIEVALPRQTNNELIQLATYAQQAKLKSSQGSDFHRVSSYTELGKLLPLPEFCEPVWTDWDLVIPA